MKSLTIWSFLVTAAFLAGYQLRGWESSPVIAQAVPARPIAAPGWTPDLQGDLNRDGGLDVSDAIYIIYYLFRGGPPMPPQREPGPRLPVTGQKRCWSGTRGGLQDPCPAPGELDHGQDAQHTETGYERDFEIVKVDASDPATWMTIDHATGLMWQYADDRLRRSWRDSLAYVEDLELGGLTDWRMPNVMELFSIMNAGNTNRFGEPDRVSYDEFFSIGSLVYWTSTTCTNESSFAFTMRFSNGYQLVNCRDKGGQQMGGNTFRTLAVRSLD